MTPPEQTQSQIQTPPETIHVQTTRVSCDGGLDNGTGGHPRVWLQIHPVTQWVQCPYCDCRFVLNATPAKS